MALLAFDGFDNYASNLSDLLSRRGGNFQWNFETFQGAQMVTPGRNGTGACILLGFADGLSGVLTTPLTTLFFGAAILVTIAAQFGPTINLSSSTGGQQLSLNFNPVSCAILFSRGNAIAVGSTPNNVFNVNVWLYLEVRVFIHPSAGSITVAVNGETVSTLTGLNTQGGSNNLVDTINFAGSGAQFGASLYVDDFYVADTTTAAGVYPFSDFVGDVQVETLHTIGNVGTPGWTPFQPAAGVLPGAHRFWRLLINQSADLHTTAIAELSLAASAGGANLIGAGTASASSVSGANTAAMAVDGNPATYWSSVAATAVAGQWLEYDFGAGASQQILEVKITAGAFLNGDQFAPNEFQLQWSDNNANWATAWTFRSAVWTAGAQQTFTITTLTNWMEVTEDNNDGDTTYNSTATVGAQDMFNYQPLSANAPLVLAVQQIGSYRKDDASARTLSQVLSSGGTSVVSAARPLSTSYFYFVDLYPLDPNTGAAWTVAAVDAVQAGYSLIS
jgi:hypothetical protein